MTEMNFTHLEIGRTSDGQLSVTLMNGKRIVGGTPNCTLVDALKAVQIVFETTTDPAAKRNPRTPEEEHELAEALDHYTDLTHPEYDPEFDAKIRKLRPDWFKGRVPSNPKAHYTATGEWKGWRDFLGRSDICDECGNSPCTCRT
jgi:hypothetical protein